MAVDLNDMILAPKPSETIPVLSLPDSEIKKTIQQMNKYRELIVNDRCKIEISETLAKIKSGRLIEQGSALLLAKQASLNPWPLITLAWIVNREFGPQESHKHMCTGSYGSTALNPESKNARLPACPQLCNGCIATQPSGGDPLISAPEIMMTPEEHVAEAKRQVAWARQHNPGAKIAFKITLFGKGLQGNGPVTDKYVEIIKAVKNVAGIDYLDACLGLLDEESAQRISEAGVYKYNCNIEAVDHKTGKLLATDEHTIEEKVETLRIARKYMKICSGVLFGRGESLEDMVYTFDLLRQLVNEGVIESSPFNSGVPTYSDQIKKIAQVPSEYPIIALCLARIMLPKHPFFPNAGRNRFGKFLPAMHLIASGYSSHHNYLTRFVDPDTDERIISFLKKE